MASPLFEQYKTQTLPELMKKRGYSNTMEVPRFEKIVLSSGIGTDKDRDMFDDALKIIGAITGQRPVITKSRKSVANFKLREGQNVGVQVTLRGQRMYDFFFRLVNIALPRVRDFRGVSAKAFDGNGNYSLGINDPSIFTEIDLDKIKHQVGMNITIVTTAGTNEEAYELMSSLGFPFVKS